MTNTTLETNKATVARFLAGTHSPDIDDVAVIDETVVPHIVCHGWARAAPARLDALASSAARAGLARDNRKPPCVT